MCTVIEQQQLAIINHLTKAVAEKNAVNNKVLEVERSSLIEKHDQPQSNIPNFKQRTWTEREREMSEERNGKLQHQNDYIDMKPDIIDLGDSDQPQSLGTLILEDTNSENQLCKSMDRDDDEHQSNDSQLTMSIADREHRKWLNPDVELLNNPYTAESIEQRTRQSMEDKNEEINHVVNDSENNDDDDGDVNAIEKKKFFSDRDITRYKRDYYLPKNRPISEDGQVFSILNVSKDSNLHLIYIISIYIY